MQYKIGYKPRHSRILLGLLPLITADPRIPLSAWSIPEVVRVIVGIVPFCGAVGVLTPMMIDRWSKFFFFITE